ncbi:MAG TPA: hypothetical protein VGQ88_10315, partial [Burkholderiales bacterium]|nr:hypothetical protein [Burkholderiales bacterium]
LVHQRNHSDHRLRSVDARASVIHLQENRRLNRAETHTNERSSEFSDHQSIAGKPEYVLIPVAVYDALSDEIEDELAGLEAAADKSADYAPFAL